MQVRWGALQEDALVRGVQKHGVGRWQAIIDDREYNSLLRCGCVRAAVRVQLCACVRTLRACTRRRKPDSLGCAAATAMACS
jgi:hypothetical protein